MYVSVSMCVCVHVCTCVFEYSASGFLKLLLSAKLVYRVEQNFGRVKLWRMNHFRVLARKTMVNLQ